METVSPSFWVQKEKYTPLDSSTVLKLLTFIVGEPLPPQLPPNLIPPSARKGATPGTPVANAPTGVVGATFEDKRKENFSKGQEVLEKRRQSLIEEQRKIEEERKRKEKEEAEAKEKAK